MPEFKTIEDITADLDLDKIVEEMAQEGAKYPGLVDALSLKDARTCVWNAMEAFLPRDLVDLEVDGVEKRIDSHVFGPNGRPFKGYLDITGTIVGNLPATKSSKGLRTIIDWKTSRQTLDTRWRDRLIDSWQWRLYCYFTKTEVFFYRGINRKGEVKEVGIRAPERAILEENVERYIAGMDAMISAFITDDLPIWPQRMPGACGMYGNVCPCKSDCESYTMPKDGLRNTDFSWSYSTMDKILTCPEYARRLINAKLDETEVPEETVDTAFGQVVHAGLAEVYRQVYDIEEENKDG